MKVWMVQMMDNNDAKLFTTEDKAMQYAKDHYGEENLKNYSHHYFIEEVEVN